MVDWKREAVDKLRCYEAKKSSAARATEEYRRLEEVNTSIRSALKDGTPVTGGCSTREDAQVSNIAHREELRLAIREARRWVRIVESGLTVLDDEERLVLDRFFIHPARGNVGRLRDELGLQDERSVYKRRDKALRHFTLALYGVIET